MTTTDKQFKIEIGVPMSRSRLKQWKREYFKQNYRTVDPKTFYENITTSLQEKIKTISQKPTAAGDR